MLLLWSTTLATIGGVALGLLVFFRSKRQIDNMSFSFVSILISLVVAANYFSLNNKDSIEITLFWIRTVMFIVPYLMFALFFFCSSYLNHSFKFNKTSFYLLLLFSLIISLINISPFAYSAVLISANGAIVPSTGPGLALNGIHILPLFLLSIFHMARNIRRNSNPKEKNMIRFSLYLFLFSFGTQIITSFVIVTIFNYTNLIPLGNFLTFLFVVLMTVSILYFKAFNLNMVEAVLFASILAILSFAEIITASGLQTIIYKIIVFITVSLVGYALIKSVNKEIKQREELANLANALEKANTKLEELDEQKDNFISMASHELNTPVAAIEGYLSMIIDEKMGGEINPKMREYLGNVYISSKRLAAMIKDLLNVSRIESNRIHIIYEEAQIEDTIKQSIAEIKPKADEVKHTLTFKEPEHKLPKTWFDVPRITEVLINMLGNSIKYTEPGGKITVEAHADADKIVVSVTDNGRGIPKEDYDKIFEKFMQVNVLTDQIKGTGLGMFITKNLVELHKGKLWFKSSTDADDHGTTFYFSLPILKEKPADPHEGEGALFQPTAPKTKNQTSQTSEIINPKKLDSTKVIPELTSKEPASSVNETKSVEVKTDTISAENKPETTGSKVKNDKLRDSTIDKKIENK